MVDIATLGIKVDSSGATKGATDLDKLSTSAQGATKSVDQLGAASSKVGAQVQTNSSRIAQAVAQNTALSSAAHNAADAHSHLAHQVHGVEAGLRATGLATAVHALGMGHISGSTVKAAMAMENFEFKASQLRTGLRVLRPLAAEAGASMGNLGVLAGAGRAGLGVLAGVITGTVLIALEKAADAARVMEGRLKSLFGVKSGAAGFHELEGVAKRTGVEIGLLANAFEELNKAQLESSFNKGWRYAPGQMAVETAKASDALETLTKLFLISGAGAEKASAGMTAFFTSALKATDQFGKTGVMTRQIFEQLEKDAPQAAEALSKAFGGGDAVRFKQDLERVPRPLTDVLKLLTKLGPTVEEQFKLTPKTVEQGIDALKADFEHLVTEMGTSGGIKFASNFINGMRDFVKGNWSWSDVGDWFNANAEGAAAAQREIGMRLGNWILEGIKSSIRDGWNSLWGGLTGPTQGAQSPESSPGGAPDLTRSIVNKYKDAFRDLGESTDKLADKAIADAAKIAQAISMLDSAGNARFSGPDDYGAGTGVTVGENATGGIYKMPGAGVSDSIRLSGRVSPGEIVAIIPADKMSGSLLSQLHDTIGQSPINIGPGGSQISAPSSYSEQERRAGQLAFHITAAQQAAARARIAQNAIATGGGVNQNNIPTISRAAISKVHGLQGLGMGTDSWTSKEWAGQAPEFADETKRITAASSDAARTLKQINGSASPSMRTTDDLNSGLLALAAMGNPAALAALYSGMDGGGNYAPGLETPLSLSGGAEPLSFGGAPLGYGDSSFGDGSEYVDAGSFARGGSFRVPNRGRGGIDGTRVGMNVTPGEQVSVTSNAESIGGGERAGAGGIHIENIHIVTPGDNPMAALSRNAIRREMGQWLR